MVIGFEKNPDVEAFLAENPVDSSAATALLRAAPEIQQAVIEKGDLNNARNPSSALQGRIKDALAESGSFFGRKTTEAHHREVELFIAEFGLDDRASEALRTAPAHVQRFAMDKGSLAETRNPSSALLGRLRDGASAATAPMASMFFGAHMAKPTTLLRPAKPTTLLRPAKPTTLLHPPKPTTLLHPAAKRARLLSPVGALPVLSPALSAGPTSSGSGPRIVEHFIAQNGVDQRAADALRRSPWNIQEVVIARGGLEDCHNPSSALLGRLRDAASLVEPEAAEEDEVEKFIAQNMLDDRASEALRSASAEAQLYVLEKGSLSDVRNPSSATLGRLKEVEGKHSKPPSMPGPDVEDLESFIAANDLDDRAIDALRSASPEAQRIVIDRGSLADMKNPSSALLGRLRDLGGNKGLSNKGPDVESFIAQNNLDERASEALRTARADVQLAVLARGSLLDVRNPSSALLGRLRDAERGGPAFLTQAQEVELFILQSELDERAATSLRTAGADVQRYVLDRGSLTDTKNPSSACLGRLREATAQVAASTRLLAGMKGSMMFVTEAGWNSRSGKGVGGRAALGGLFRAVETFLAESGVDESAAQALRNAPEELQRAVLERGSVSDTRNPSSALLGRLRDAQRLKVSKGFGFRTLV